MSDIRPIKDLTRCGDEESFDGGKNCKRPCPSINHILFMDDTMVFCKANVEEGRVLKNILRDYEMASGLKVNVEKSSVSFESQVSSSSRGHIGHVLGMCEVQDQGKYLGLPSHIGRSKKYFQLPCSEG
ncbi:hypothetical protein LIER_42820 [Lithospermum erythrorhizon]|uniref:Reverse transcriptase domain-containing protein n=1 Tax=Lithospermum erythrorhizon TaxID=34254 RepID=A0AAV3P0B0_LITER